MKNNDMPLPCGIKTFPEKPVLDGYPAFIIKCPLCNNDSLVLITKEALANKILFCPVCWRKLKFDNNELASAIRQGIINIGKDYNENNKNQILDNILTVVRTLRQYANVYFVKLRSERIGHYAANTFGFMTTLNYDKKLENSVIFAFDRKAPNSPCNQMFRLFLGKYVSFQPWVEDIYELCAKSEDLAETAVDASQDYFLTETAHTFFKMPLKIEFNNAERDMGTNELRRLGVEPGKSFVCFLGRDNKYTTEIKGLSIPNLNSARNMDIRTFLPTMRWFAAQGIYCLRIGNMVEYSIEEPNPFIIDCSLSDTNPVIDFYAAGNCAMFIGVSSGVCEFAALRKIPSLIVNYLHYNHMLRNYQTNAFIIYKKFYSIKDNRYLSFKNVIEHKLCRQLPLSDYTTKLSLRVDPNTPEEILEAAKEIWARINGGFIMTPDMGALDDKVQKLYRGFLHKYFLDNYQNKLKVKDHDLVEPPASIPLSFLRANPFFLDDGFPGERTVADLIAKFDHSRAPYA